MSIEKKSLISTLKTTKKANVAISTHNEFDAKPQSVLSKRSPVLGKKAPVLGKRSPVLGKKAPVLGKRSPVLG